MFDRYTRREVLGRGSLGTVHRGEDRQHPGRVVAIKHVAGGDVGREAVLAEVAALTRLDHPSVVRVLDVVEERDGVAIVTPFLPGGSLADRLHDGPLSPAAVADLGARLGEALAAAHDAGVVHRDVKPANVLYDAEEQPLLADFGAALVDVDGDGWIVGSAAYLDPTVALDGAPADPASDQYALGVTLYEALAGVRPHVAASAEATLRVADRASHVPLAAHAPHAPVALCEVIERAMARRPQDRFATVREVAARLAEVRTRLAVDPSSDRDVPTWRADRAAADGRPAPRPAPPQRDRPTTGPPAPPAPGTGTPPHADVPPSSGPPPLPPASPPPAGPPPAGQPTGGQPTGGQPPGLTLPPDRTGPPEPPSTTPPEATTRFGPAPPKRAAPPPEPAPPPRRRALWIAAAAAVLVVPIAVVFLLRGGGDQPLDDPAASAPPDLPRCDDAPPAPDAPAVVDADLDGAGCGIPLGWDPEDLVLTVPVADGTVQRFQLGEPGDVLLIGAWECDEVRSPGLFRPETGQLFAFAGFDPSGEAPESLPARDVPDGDGPPRVVRDDDGCDRVTLDPA